MPEDQRPAIDLGYASPPPPGARQRIPLSGVISFALLAFQVPWFVILLFLDWGKGIVNLRGLPETLAFGLFYCPALVALGFGAYSLKKAGIALRNILGVIGFLVPATLIAIEVLFLLYDLVRHVWHRL